ncbi:MAG: hypothetical protein PHZ13_07440, partial [bacterium]|nr:hypothetical protein [bacterium]
VQIGAILYRGEPYGYYGNGKHPYGFKPTEEIMKVDFGRSYIGSGMSRREDDKIVFDDYEVFEHTFPFTPEPGGFYGIVPARGRVGTGLFAQMSVNILDYYGLRFFTFRGRAVEE